jgi:hypothetical protein
MRDRSGHVVGPHGRRRATPALLALGAMVLTLAFPLSAPADAATCPDVPHTSEPVELDCASESERWAVIDSVTGLVTNVAGWTGTNLWRPPAGQFAKDLPVGSPVGPGWWYVDGTFVRDSFERNVTARAQILGVQLSWSTGGLGTDSGSITFVIDVQPTGQRFETGGSSLLIDPLTADVAHTFTVTAILPDGRTVQGPVVTATPKPDPDPDCTDHSVARECRAATGWAVVHPSTGMVENVIVCTPWQCGVDGAWGGRMPDDTPWPGYLLIELTGNAGIGWQYVDGRFVDVRPVESVDEGAPADTPSDAPAAGEDPATGDATPGPGPETGADADGSSDDPAPSAPGTEDSTSSGDARSDDPTDVEDGTTLPPGPAPDASEPDTDLEAAALGRSGAAADTRGQDTEDTVDTERVDEVEVRPAGPFRRVVDAIGAFIRGLFSR